MKTLGLSLLVLGFLATANSTKGDAEKKKRPPRFTISKETTYVTGPVDKDGYIDYAAALNNRLSQGVTPESNANVLLWKALGPLRGAAARTVPPEYFQRMGIAAPPDRGDYYISVYQYAKDHLKIDPQKKAKEIGDQQDHTMERPWRAKAYPIIAAWLKANEKPLALVVGASKRSHYYFPLLPERPAKGPPGPLMSALLPGLQEWRDFARVLVTRAMLRAGEGDYEAAWQDLLACHRLGRLVATGGAPMEWLAGTAIDELACEADPAFLEAAPWKGKRMQECLGDLQKLPPMPELAVSVAFTERLNLLDLIMNLDRGPESLQAIFGKPPARKAEVTMPDIDWDPALRDINRWFDRFASALREKDRAARNQKLKQIQVDLRALQNTAKLDSLGEQINAVLGSKQTPGAKGKVLGNILITRFTPMLASLLARLQQTADRSAQRYANATLAFALAAYQRDHGRYPEKLDALAPQYLVKIPQDLFSGKPLIYRPSKNAYLLYSVGVNGKDEEGRGDEDKPPGDDLSVRMPLPKLGKE